MMNNSTSNFPSNFDPGSTRYNFQIFLASALIVVIFIAVVGNLLVCIAIILNSQLRSSPTMFFIFSLALSDLSTASLSMPFDAEQLLANFKWTHSEALCQTWTSAYLITVPCSIWNLLVVSIDRYKSLKDPLSRYRQSPFMTRKRAALVIVSVWIYSVLFALIPVMGWKIRLSSVMDSTCYFNMTTDYSVMSSFVNFVFPLLVMCFLYLKIFAIARSINRPAFQLTNKTLVLSAEAASDVSTDNRSKKRAKRSQKRFKKNLKAAKNILIIVCAFLLCWMPHTLLSLVAIFLGREYYQEIPAELFQVFLLLGYINAALNPPLYTFHNKRFKETYVRIVGLGRKKVKPKRSSNLTALTNIEPSREGSTQRRVGGYKHIQE